MSNPSNLDLHNTLSDIRTDVAVIKEKVERLPDHERRIRGLERFRWIIVGMGTIVAGVWGSIKFHVFGGM
jgi:ribosomal silencing factor RsfS|tara:strand:+ start:4147 stop:4356 length:210 start_codon:yes stop_codon:yes gene_type:complete